MLRSVVEWMVRLAPSQHRELARGMLAELDSIEDSAERIRFAWGAIAAMARLAVSPSRPFVGLEEPADVAGRGTIGPKLSATELLRRHALPFALSLAALTTVLLVGDAERWGEQLHARGAPDGAMLEVVLFAIPHTLALTIPMAVFLAVSWVFTRLGAEGVLTAARRERHGGRRLLAPILGAAAVMSVLALASNTEVLPRANARLVAVLEGAPRGPTDRTMTLGELRDAAREARTAQGPEVVRATDMEVEIQKKLAISAACLFLALIAAALAMRFPRGGGKLVLAASNLVFIGFWLLLIAGEVLADRQLLSPLVAMWIANACLLAVALVLVRRPRSAGAPGGPESLAIDG